MSGLWLVVWVTCQMVYFGGTPDCPTCAVLRSKTECQNNYAIFESTTDAAAYAATMANAHIYQIQQELAR
jgi:hypothetical protein